MFKAVVPVVALAALAMSPTTPAVANDLMICRRVYAVLTEPVGQLGVSTCPPKS